MIFSIGHDWAVAYIHQFLGRKDIVHDAILERVCDKRRCIQLGDDIRPELVEPVSFTFDTIKLGSMIVCGLPASPHDLVHESNAGRRLLRVLR